MQSSSTEKSKNAHDGETTGYRYARFAIIALAAVAIVAIVCASISVPVSIWLTKRESSSSSESVGNHESYQDVPPAQEFSTISDGVQPVAPHDVLPLVPSLVVGANVSSERAAPDFRYHDTGGSCGSGEFQCAERCISLTQRCNKRRDCRNGEDEAGCSCSDYLSLSAHHKICDGFPDCPDHSDERFCPNVCNVNQYECPRARHCILISQVCDGNSDCGEGEDEEYCARLAPAIDAASNEEYYSEGFLLVRNRGSWYYACDTSRTSEFFADACRTLGYSRVNGIGGRKTMPRGAHPEQFINFVGQAFATKSQAALFPNTRLGRYCSGGIPLYFGCSKLKCGISPACQPQRSRIVGGKGAGLSCHPWAVALYSGGRQKCMGVVLSKNYIITAAHCFKDADHRSNHWVARFGFTRQHSHSPHESVRRIDYVIMHPDYSGAVIEKNDIALARIDQPIRFSPYVRPACLDSIFGDPREPRPGTRCTALGWGFRGERQQKSVDSLQKVSLRVMDTGRCNTSGPFRGKIEHAHLCLSHGSLRKDACQGDSGGPLLCPDAYGKQFLAGLTSTGYGCARRDVPGVWTRLRTFVPWIKQRLANPVGGYPVANPECSGFRCRLGECIFRWFRCDYNHDCPIDGSDEQRCDS